MERDKILNALLWSARLWGAVVLLFMVVMVGSHIVGSFMEAGEEGVEGFQSIEEMITFIVFPVGLMIGLAVAQFRYRIGGFICLFCMIAFLIFRPDQIFDYMIYSIGLPGLLFLLYSYLKK